MGAARVTDGAPTPGGMLGARAKGVASVKWLSGQRGRVQDVAERLTGRGLFRVARDSAALSDRETVRRWLRGLHAERDQQVLIHRRWGTLDALTASSRPQWPDWRYLI